MFKKLLALMLALTLSSSFIACGETVEQDKTSQNDNTNNVENTDENVSETDDDSVIDTLLQDPTQNFTVIVEGQSYNLADDFETTIASMVKNGIEVRYAVGTKLMLYDENGKLYEVESYDKSKPHFYYTRGNTSFSGDITKLNELRKEKGDLVCDIYPMYATNITFELPNGICSTSSVDELKSLDGFIEKAAIQSRKNFSYGAVYVNGEPLDFSDYEDIYNAWVEDVNNEGFSAATTKHFPNRFYSISNLWQYDDLRTCQNIEEVEAICSNMNIPCKAEILFTCAMIDAGKMLEEGKIDSYSIVCFEDLDGEGLLMQYNKIYFYKKSDSQ